MPAIYLIIALIWLYRALTEQSRTDRKYEKHKEDQRRRGIIK